MEPEERLPENLPALIDYAEGRRVTLERQLSHFERVLALIELLETQKTPAAADWQARPVEYRRTLALFS